MTVEIVHSELLSDDIPAIWACRLEITQNSMVYALPATAPGDLLESELQAYFDAQEDALWGVAQIKQIAPDVTLYLPERELLRRLLGVLLDELNALRQLHGLPDRTLEQLKHALRSKL